MSFSVRCSSPFNSNSHAKPIKASTPTKVVAVALGVIAMTVGLLITFGVITALGPLSSTVGWSLFGGGALLFLIGSLVKCVKTHKGSDTSSETSSIRSGSDIEDINSDEEEIVAKRSTENHETRSATSSKSDDSTSSSDSDPEGSELLDDERLEKSSRHSVEESGSEEEVFESEEALKSAQEVETQLTQTPTNVFGMPNWLYQCVEKAPRFQTNGAKLTDLKNLGPNAFASSFAFLHTLDAGYVLAIKCSAQIVQYELSTHNDKIFYRNLGYGTQQNFMAIIAKNGNTWNLTSNLNPNFHAIFSFDSKDSETMQIIDTEFCDQVTGITYDPNNLKWLLLRLLNNQKCLVQDAFFQFNNAFPWKTTFWEIKLNTYKS